MDLKNVGFAQVDALAVEDIDEQLEVLVRGSGCKGEVHVVCLVVFHLEVVHIIVLPVERVSFWKLRPSQGHEFRSFRRIPQGLDLNCLLKVIISKSSRKPVLVNSGNFCSSWVKQDLMNELIGQRSVFKGPIQGNQEYHTQNWQGSGISFVKRILFDQITQNEQGNKESHV